MSYFPRYSGWSLLFATFCPIFLPSWFATPRPLSFAFSASDSRRRSSRLGFLTCRALTHSQFLKRRGHSQFGAGFRGLRFLLSRLLIDGIAIGSFFGSGNLLLQYSCGGLCGGIRELDYRGMMGEFEASFTCARHPAPLHHLIYLPHLLLPSCPIAATHSFHPQPLLFLISDSPMDYQLNI